MSQATELNGIAIGKWQQLREHVQRDPLRAERNPTAVAQWVGEQRSRIEFGNIVTHLGGQGELNPMQTLLASLAACTVDLIALHASLLGIQVESLSVRATGHFNVRSYLGCDDVPGSGYDTISYTVRLCAPSATQEQIAYLRERCEHSSPVGDSLARPIRMNLEFIPEAD
jgi:uncharacterized OsmC-like protein